MRIRFLILCACVLFGSGAPLRADTVVLVDGNRFENVRVLFYDDRVNLIFADSTLLSFREAEVRSVLNASVSWQPGVGDEEFERLAKEKIAALNERIREEERARAERERELSRRSLLLSIFLPGLGQFYSGRPGRGLFFSASSLALLGRSFVAYQKQGQEREVYAEQLTPALYTLTGAFLGGSLEAAAAANLFYFDIRRAQLQEADTNLRQSVLLLGVLWFFNVVEAYFFPESPDDEDYQFGDETALEFDLLYDAAPQLHSRNSDRQFSFRLQARF
ncbi:MAG: hypothetical protein NXI24_08165 [bacterium]|nr:hypothetical protein [bacterium]